MSGFCSSHMPKTPVETDRVCRRILGFDYARIPVFRHAMRDHRYPWYHGEPQALEIASDRCSTFADVYDSFNCNLQPRPGGRAI